MAPRPTGTRRSNAQNEHFFELGVQGRKTGVTLRDTGARDEHGMQPLEDIFSSPEKTARNIADEYSDDDSSGQEMEIENTTAPDPAALMRGQGNTLRMSIPRSRSPMKTYLESPARQNPYLNHNSSPARGSVVEFQQPSRSQTVKRRLDFSVESTSRSFSQPTTSVNGGRSVTNGGGARARPNGVRNGSFSQDEDGEEEATILHGEQQEGDSRGAEESMAMIDEGGDDMPETRSADEHSNDHDDAELGDDSQDAEEVVQATATSSRGRPRKTGAARDPSPPAVEEDDAEPVQRRRGRPPKNKAAGGENPREQRGSTKRRRSNRIAEEDEEEEAELQPEPDPEPEPKKQRTGGNARGRKPTKKANTATPADESSEPSNQHAKPANKGKRGRPRRSSAGEADTSLAVVPRGPPLPKSRGLLISRREVPGDDAILRTRSGRNSYRPLAFWRNEHVDYDQDQAIDDAFSTGGNPTKFILPTLKEIHRVDEPEYVPPKRRGRPAKAGGRGGSSTKGRRRKSSGADEPGLFDEPAEPWEEEPGTISGDAVVWQPEYEYAPPGLDEEIEVAPEQLAVSGLAIETREIRNASFRFAKTLSLPFFGAGVVDLPPGSEKRPKNSRKMYLTFFVYAGTVLVTVNESTFRIGRGGMWFVPRGNTYSIENDYDQPARVFFSQGCEPTQQPADEGTPA